MAMDDGYNSSYDSIHGGARASLLPGVVSLAPLQGTSPLLAPLPSPLGAQRSGLPLLPQLGSGLLGLPLSTGLRSNSGLDRVGSLPGGLGHVVSSGGDSGASASHSGKNSLARAGGLRGVAVPGHDDMPRSDDIDEILAFFELEGLPPVPPRSSMQRSTAAAPGAAGSTGGSGRRGDGGGCGCAGVGSAGTSAIAFGSTISWPSGLSSLADWSLAASADRSLLEPLRAMTHEGLSSSLSLTPDPISTEADLEKEVGDDGRHHDSGSGGGECGSKRQSTAVIASDVDGAVSAADLPKRRRTAQHGDDIGEDSAALADPLKRMAGNAILPLAAESIASGCRSPRGATGVRRTPSNSSGASHDILSQASGESEPGQGSESDPGMASGTELAGLSASQSRSSRRSESLDGRGSVDGGDMDDMDDNGSMVGEACDGLKHAHFGNLHGLCALETAGDWAGATTTGRVARPRRYNAGQRSTSWD